MTAVSFKTKLIALLAVVACALAMVFAFTATANADEVEGDKNPTKQAKVAVTLEFTYDGTIKTAFDASKSEGVHLSDKNKDKKEISGKDAKADYKFKLVCDADYYIDTEKNPQGKITKYITEKEYTWKINKYEIQSPVISAVTYNGENILVAELATYPDTFAKLGEVFEMHSCENHPTQYGQIDAGTYPVCFKLKKDMEKNYKWKANATDDAHLDLTWTISPIVLDAADVTYVKGSKDAASMTCNGLYGDFLGVVFDGMGYDVEDLAEYGITVKAGSTVISADSKLLDQMKAGTYDVTFIYNNADKKQVINEGEEAVEDLPDTKNYIGDDGSAYARNGVTFTATLTIKDGVAKTGDSALPIAVALALVAAAGAVLVLRRQRD